MATNLVISYPDIPFSAVYINPANTTDSVLGEWNLGGSYRHNFFQFASAAASNTIRYDLGSGTTKAIDHLVIARADILKSIGVTSVTLDRGSDGAAWTNQYTDASFASSTLYGPRGDDYCAEIATSSAFRWWRLGFVATSCKFTCSKVYFGSFFDMGIDVDSYDFTRTPVRDATFETDSGTQVLYRADEPTYKFTFTWVNVTDTAKENFFNYIVRWAKKNPVFLYTKAQHQILDNQRVIHASLLSAESEPTYSNKNTIKAVFQEQVA